MRQKLLTGSVIVVLAIALAGCGDDDDGGASAPPTDSDGPSTDAGVTVATDLTPDNDLVAGILGSTGVSADVVTDEERECMNQVLAPSFPTGLPPGLAPTDEFDAVYEALDTAAEACDVVL